MWLMLGLSRYYYKNRFQYYKEKKTVVGSNPVCLKLHLRMEHNRALYNLLWRQHNLSGSWCRVAVRHNNSTFTLAACKKRLSGWTCENSSCKSIPCWPTSIICNPLCYAVTSASVKVKPEHSKTSFASVEKNSLLLIVFKQSKTSLVLY